MKKLVKLAIYYSLTLAILMIVSTGLRFLASWIEVAGVIPQQPEIVLAELIAAAGWALSMTIYGGLLLGLSYAVRKKVLTLSAVLCIGVLSIGFACVMGFVLRSWENVPQAVSQRQPLGGPGLIVANNANLNGTAVVLLNGLSDPGPRVVAVPGSPLFYRDDFSNRNVVSLPSSMFSSDSPRFLKSLAIDLRMSAGNMKKYFDSGLLWFLLYAGSLVVFLTSLIFVFRFSAWPLANLFLGCLAFRGILALEVFFNSPEMQDVFDSFLQGRVPVSLVVPFIFCGIGALAYLYSFLVFLAKRRDDYAV